MSEREVFIASKLICLQESRPGCHADRDLIERNQKRSLSVSMIALVGGRFENPARVWLSLFEKLGGEDS